MDGQRLPAQTAQELRLSLTNDRYRTSKGDQVLFDSSYRLEAGDKIFIVGNEGDLAGKEAQGIFKLEGETLTICYVMPGGPAPTAFESAPGSKAYLITWQRLK